MMTAWRLFVGSWLPVCRYLNTLTATALNSWSSSGVRSFTESTITTSSLPGPTSPTCSSTQGSVFRVLLSTIIHGRWCSISYCRCSVPWKESSDQLKLVLLPLPKKEVCDRFSAIVLLFVRWRDYSKTFERILIKYCEGRDPRRNWLDLGGNRESCGFCIVQCLRIWIQIWEFLDEVFLEGDNYSICCIKQVTAEVWGLCAPVVIALFSLRVMSQLT